MQLIAVVVLIVFVLNLMQSDQAQSFPFLDEEDHKTVLNREVERRNTVVFSSAFSPFEQGKQYLACASNLGRITLWSTDMFLQPEKWTVVGSSEKTPPALLSWKAHNGPIHSLVFVGSHLLARYIISLCSCQKWL